MRGLIAGSAGLVFYQMLSGKHPFYGELVFSNTMQDLRGAILEHAPDMGVTGAESSSLLCKCYR